MASTILVFFDNEDDYRAFRAGIDREKPESQCCQIERMGIRKQDSHGCGGRKGSVGGLPVIETREACFDRRLYSRRINSDAAAVCREVNVILDRIDHLSHLSDNDQFDVKVILSELLQNAIRHGNAMDQAKMIALDVTLDDQDTLEISVQDEGSGFDIERVLAQKRVKSVEAEDVFALDEFGRGLLIIESLCDTVCRNDRGNRITIRKQMQHL